MTSAFFSTLSFNAEQNCAQNNGANLRDDINCLIMVRPVCQPCNRELPSRGRTWQQTMRVMYNEGLTRGAALSCLCAQELFGSSFFYSINHAARFMKVAHGLGERETGLHHHSHPHGKIGTHPPIERKREDPAADHEHGCAERNVAEINTGAAGPIEMCRRHDSSLLNV